METPGGEGITEEFPRHLHGDNYRNEHRGGQPEIARRFQRDEGHGQRPAGDRHRCSAPWPDDMTGGEIIARPPTMRPPSAGRSAGFSRRRENNISQAATPRIKVMPKAAASRPNAPA